MTAWVMVVLAANAVDGGLAITDVEDVLQLNAATLAPCFVSKKSAPVKVHFDVMDGGVSGVSAREPCVSAAVTALAFPPVANSSVNWTVTKPRDTTSADDAVVLEPDALAPFDGDVTACYVAAGPDEKVEGSASLEVLVLRSGAVMRVALVEQSPRFEKTTLSRCLEGRATHWRFTGSTTMRRVRIGWVFATSERRARMLYVPSERRREIVGQASESSGGLDRDVILKIINGNQSQMRFCYETQLQRFAKLAGKVSASWKIGPDGSVIQVSITENETGNEALEKCIVEKLKTWSFPPPSGGGVVAVSYPWIFRPARDDDDDE